MGAVSIFGLFAMVLGIAILLGGGSIYLWNHFIKPAREMKHNAKVLAIFDQAAQLIMEASSAHDVPMDETITALNAAVDTYNESLMGDDSSSLKIDHFPLVRNTNSPQERSE